MQYLTGNLTIEHALAVLYGFFLFCTASLTISCLIVRRDLNRTLTALKEIFNKSQMIDIGVYRSISAKMLSSKLLSHAWHEFDETTVKDESDKKVPVYNTRSFSEFFDREDFLDNSLNIGFFKKVPAMITSIGLFFTFLFIIFGLAQLQPQANGKIEGVTHLITGLSSKFVSSVFAIFYALIFTIFEDRTMKGMEKKYFELVHLLDLKFVRKSGEDYLRTISEGIRELNAQLQVLGKDESTILKSSETQTFDFEPARQALEKSALQNKTTAQYLDQFMLAFQEIKKQQDALLENFEQNEIDSLPHRTASGKNNIPQNNNLLAAIDGIQKCNETTKLAVANFMKEVEIKTVASQGRLESTVLKLVSTIDHLNSNVIVLKKHKNISGKANG